MSSQVGARIGDTFQSRSSTSSLTDSIPSGTSSSLSFAWGPGALAGMFLRWLGESTLDAVVLVVIRTRLVFIKQTVRERPHIFQEASTSAETFEVRRIYKNLQELCRKDYYPLAIKRKAARLVLEIAYLVYIKQFKTLAELSRSLSTRANLEDPWDRWSTLLRLCNLSALTGIGYHLPRPPPTRSISTEWSSGVVSAAATTLPLRSRSMSTDYISGIASTGATTTVTTRNTATSNGRTSGFFSEARSSVTSLGSIGRETVLEIGVRRKLSRIKRTIRRHPHIFLGSQEVKQMQEVDYIYNELQDLCQFHASPSTRRRAARLVLEISALISGPDDILTINDSNSSHNESSRMWIKLVTRPHVHSLLSVGAVTGPNR